MKVATWNVNSLRVRLEQVTSWLERRAPDLLALQETKIKDEDFPVEPFEQLGYRVLFNGQAAYNGVALLSRKATDEVATRLAGFEDDARRVLAATCGALRVINLYVPNGQHVDSDKYRYKLEWLAALRAQLKLEIVKHPYCVVLGDFNIAPEDRDVYDPVAWQGKVLCSDAERDALAAILEVGFVDTFRLFAQPENTYSWWDYRAGAFRRNRGLRIDLVLASRALSERCTACTIDAEPRGWERPSDHTPVISEFAEF